MARTHSEANQDRRTLLIPVAMIAVVALVLIGWRLLAPGDPTVAPSADPSQTSADPASNPATTASPTSRNADLPSHEQIRNAPLAVPSSCASLHSEVFAETDGETMNVSFSNGHSRPTDVFDAGVMEIVSISDGEVEAPVFAVVVRCHGPYGAVDSLVIYDADLRFRHALEPYWDEDLDVLGGVNPEFFTMNDAAMSGSDITFVAGGLVPADQPEVGGVGEANAHYRYVPTSGEQPFERVSFDIFYSDGARAAIDEASRGRDARGGAPAGLSPEATEAAALLVAATPADTAPYVRPLGARFTTPSGNWTCAFASTNVTCFSTGSAPIPLGDNLRGEDWRDGEAPDDGVAAAVLVGRDGPAMLVSAEPDTGSAPTEAEVLNYGERLDWGLFACTVDQQLGVVCATEADYSFGFQLSSTRLTLW